jgi:peptidoglycan/xylan/chitin deacetylase (PgdA/CDA1 family)
MGRIVLYHSIPSEHTESFENQIRFLSENYSVVSLTDFVGGLSSSDCRGQALIAVTFDEGFEDCYHNAVPILLRYKVPACFFVSPNFIDLSEKRDLKAIENFCRYNLLTKDMRNPMNWHEIKELKRLGFEIGSHTLSHAWCSRCTEEELFMELALSKDRIEKEINAEVTLFAFPFGTERHIDARAVRIAQDVGYRCACWARRGWNTPQTNLYKLHRDPIDPAWSLDVVKGVLSGLFDWWRPKVV